MFNKKAQEISIWGVIYGIIGFGISVWISGLMGAGMIARFIAIAVTTVVCYIIGHAASSH